MRFKHIQSSTCVALAMLLAACGGSSNSDSTPSSPSTRLLSNIISGGTSSGTTEAAASAAITPAAASHFLAQATFGPNLHTIDMVTASGKSAWIEEQFAKPQLRHLDYVQHVAANLPAGTNISQNQFSETWWRQAVGGEDQLRQRVTFALSQIFVISMVDSNLEGRPAGVASYYDMLGQYAFGNFRDLLQAVALHPMMGIYLSHLHNEKESGARVPDENFAREIMQLMTIGLHQLNPDGSVKISGGKPIETYTHDDVAGLAKVFTGWSWSGPGQGFYGGRADVARDWTPMQQYASYHSTSAKSFLGVNVAAGGTGESDLKIALDTLFNHPNVGPFIGRQLIQRLVSSNPSPAYISRVAAAFADNGKGVRGDLRAVIRAVLLDPEAADTGRSKKLREPLLRLANWMRAFHATSASRRYLIVPMDDPIHGLGQSPMRSPSVFNYFRPGYSPPNTTLSDAGLVAPEMQITGEPTVTGYLNFMQSVIPYGLGTGGDVQPIYTAEIAIADSPKQLVDRMKLLLLGGSISTTLNNQLMTAISAITLPVANGSNAAEIEKARRNRVCMAIYMTMAAPEYVAQR